MPLTSQQVALLDDAIKGYAFPPAYFDFATGTALSLTMPQVEHRVQADLTSSHPASIKDGLSNVLYWGYAQMGIQAVRVSNFRSRVTVGQLKTAKTVLQQAAPPSLSELKRLKLPEFSGVSFVSKIRMFLDPARSATLDRQIMKLHAVWTTTVLANVRLYANFPQIPITKQNSTAYELWNNRLLQISASYFGARYRAVDIERGLFQLIQTGGMREAAEILRDA
jgi:hypothetical protein